VLGRLKNLTNVPKGYPKLFLFVLYGLKPDKKTLHSALKSIDEMLLYLRKNFDYEALQKEFPKWWSKYNQFLI